MCLFVCMCVCLCVCPRVYVIISSEQNISKSCGQIFFRRGGGAAGTNRLDFGGDLVTPILPQFFAHAIDFQWDSNRLPVFAAWQHCSARGIKQT